MYDLVLKQATGDPEFRFEMRSTAMPKNYYEQTLADQNNIVGLNLALAVTSTMVLSTIAGSVVSERAQGLKHMQRLSGLSLTAYWTGNFLADLSKVLFFNIGVAATIAVGMGHECFPWVILQLSFPLLMFVYVMSCLFNSDNTAQLSVMMLSFYLIVVLGPSILADRLDPDKELEGD